MRHNLSPKTPTGSMADIAFLLLVFWMMTTSMQTEEGILSKLPPIDREISENIAQEDVLNIHVNLKDELLANGSAIEIDELKLRAREFLTNGGVFENVPAAENMTKRYWLRKIEVKKKINMLKDRLSKNTGLKEMQNDTLLCLNDQLVALEFFGDFKVMKSKALIAIQHDPQTTYETFIEIQNELHGALNDLRNELSIKHFGLAFNELDKNRQHREIKAIRLVYPQKISESEFNR